MGPFRNLFGRMVDRLSIKETTVNLWEQGQLVEVLRITALFPWRCQAMITEYMFMDGGPRRLYLNGRRLM